MTIKLNTSNMRRGLSTIVLLVSLLGFCGFATDGGCNDAPTPQADQQQQAQQERMSLQSNQEIGMPGITNYEEKRIMKRLYEMRDKNIATYTYILDMNGNLHHVCDSMGYGLPYATQFSNPEKMVNPYGQVYTNLPQSEPNGGLDKQWRDAARPICGCPGCPRHLFQPNRNGERKSCSKLLARERERPSCS